MAIFQMNENYEICSFLIHSGETIPACEEGDFGWKRCSITWRVADIGDLKSLCGGAQHLLGILEWSSGDIMKLYCESNAEWESDQK
jgi:hypothetical protein